MFAAALRENLWPPVPNRVIVSQSCNLRKTKTCTGQVPFVLMFTFENYISLRLNWEGQLVDDDHKYYTIEH